MSVKTELGLWEAERGLGEYMPAQVGPINRGALA